MIKGHPLGVHSNKADPKTCMVVKCDRTALYRNNLSKRGYCASHKAYAIRRWEPQTQERADDNLLRGVKA